MRFVCPTSPSLLALCAATLTVCGLFLPCRSAHAQSASESFAYAPSVPLLGQNGGNGFSGPWSPGGFNASIFTNYTVAGGSLTFPGLSSSGDSVTTGSNSAITGLTRPLTTPLGTAGTSAYLSFLMRADGTVGQGFSLGYFGLHLNASTGNDLFIGKPGNINQYVLETRGGGGQVASTVTAVSGETHLFVLRADFTAGVDTFTLFIDPTMGQPEPLAGIVKQDTDAGTISGLTLYSSGAYTLDEIRIGSTYADVTAAVGTTAPEPGSLALLLPVMGAAGMVIRKQKRSKG